MMCPQCAQELLASDKFCCYCGYAIAHADQAQVFPPETENSPSIAVSKQVGGVAWKKLLLAFLVLLLVLAVGTWYMMRGAASNVLKTPAYQQPAVVQQPVAEDVASSAVDQQTAETPALEVPLQNPQEPLEESVNQGLSGDRALIY